MSTQEVAEAINEYLYLHWNMTTSVDHRFVSNYEGGMYRWPARHYREAFRAVLGAATDAELGFYVKRMPRSQASKGSSPRGQQPIATELDDPSGAAGGDVRRRVLLGGIAAAAVVAGTGGGEKGPNNWLRRDLLARRWVHDGDAPSLAEVEAQVRGAIVAYQSADYLALGRLPGLIAGAEQVVGATTGAEQDRPYRALAWANLIASKLAAKVGDGTLAWIVADRAASCAMHLSDSALSGVAAYQTACALVKTPHGLDFAEHVAMTAVDHLACHRSHSTPAFLSVQGALLLQAAVIAARQGRPDVAGERLDRAGRLANLLHRDGNELWTAFGPTNVQLHRLAVAVELGATKQALQIGDQLDTSGMPQALLSRRAQVHVDLAAAHVVTSSADPQAVLHLLEAERIAPQVIKHNAKARAMLTALLGRERRSATPGLRPLAQRADVAA